MTLTAINTTPAKTSAELLDILRGLTVGQQNALRYGHDAYTKRRQAFFPKWPTTTEDVEALCPDYLTKVAPGQYQITELGLNVYRAHLHRPVVDPNAGSKPQMYHGTRQGRNRTLSDLWEQRLPANGLPAATAEPAAVPAVAATEPVVATPTQQPVSEPAPVSPSLTPAVVQLDLTAFIQPLLAQIAALETKLAQVSAPPAPQPPFSPRRKSSRAAMPMAVLV